MNNYDVVVIGGGHNGLAGASYLAKNGLSVLVLEKEGNLGGAAVSAQAFAGHDARLSRYSYLVSLLPDQIVADLGLDIRLAPRRYGSFTPDPANGGETGLLIDQSDALATADSFDGVGSRRDFAAWQEFYGRTDTLAAKLAGAVLEPLPTASEVAELLGPELWRDFFERPIGEVIEESFESDLVRGVVLTDALIGTFAPNVDPELQANKCFLYHVIGNGTGEWNIPVGGMGSVSGALAKSAREFGAELLTDCEVVELRSSGAGAGAPAAHQVVYIRDGQRHTASARYVLANVAAPVLARLAATNGGATPAAITTRSGAGAQVKVNMLLKRLPRLRSGVDPAAAFGGTFHINETYTGLQAAFEQAASGIIPNPLPCEIYCHSLTDPSILGPELRASGAQTLTVFALHTPHELLAGHDHDTMRAAFEAAVIDSINSVIDEDILDLLLTDAHGNPCIETKTTQDLEDALGLPGGNIFHVPLSWPFVPDGTPLDTPARRWGVESGIEGVWFCGSSARRGGAVSAIGGHNAAMAVLEAEAAREG